MNLIKKIINKENIFALIVVAVLFAILLQVFTLQSSISRLEDNDHTRISEIGEIKDIIGLELNEMRGRINLPEKTYFAGDIESEGDEGGGESSGINDLQTAMFDYTNFLAKTEKKEIVNRELLGLLEQLNSSENFANFLAANGLMVSGYSDLDASAVLTISNIAGVEISKYYLDKLSAELYLKSTLEKLLVDVANYEEFEADAQTYLTTKKDEIFARINEVETALSSIEGALTNVEVLNALAEREIKVSDSYEKDMLRHYPFLNKSEEAIGEILLDMETLKIELVDMGDEEGQLFVTDLNVSLLPFVEGLNTMDFFEKKVAEKRESIEKYLADAGFQAFLEKSGLKISMEPVEDNGRLLYKIFNSADVHLSSIVIESTGVVVIAKPDGTKGENILLFDPEEGEKKNELEIPDLIPEYGDEAKHDDGTFNILIAGKHGNLVDTMIFAHINEETKDVRMISVPRDLYYKGRKINAYPYFYGMDELKRALSDMTGYELDKYILIDMYTFIDVVDLIGGVDVHLDKAVIDPTYVTEDNGVWSTLHYEPGDYHFSGKQALRIARSRHTSSDFARAERQQIILKSLQGKAQNMGFGEADTFYEIVKTVLAKTETDISFDDAIAYYFKYQNYDILSNDVMSSGNVLYSPPYITMANCEAQIAAAQAAGAPTPGCVNMSHAYTLQPRGNNWNVIKWFFEEKFG